MWETARTKSKPESHRINPWNRMKVEMGPWETWSRGGIPAHGRWVGTRWSWSPFQPKPFQGSGMWWMHFTRGQKSQACRDNSQGEDWASLLQEPWVPTCPAAKTNHVWPAQTSCPETFSPPLFAAQLAGNKSLKLSSYFKNPICRFYR